MKKKYLIPRKLEILIIVFSILLVCLMIITVRQYYRSVQYEQYKQIASRALESQLERKDNIIYAYNQLLHRIWVDNPNYVEDVLVECDEWVSLDQLVDGDFYGAFELETESDSIAYHLNWERGN